MLELCGLGQAGDSLVFFFFLFYLVSIVENWGQMGLPLPSWVKDHIYKLSKDYLLQKKVIEDKGVLTFAFYEISSIRALCPRNAHINKRLLEKHKIL